MRWKCLHRRATSGAVLQVTVTSASKQPTWSSLSWPLSAFSPTFTPKVLGVVCSSTRWRSVSNANAGSLANDALTRPSHATGGMPWRRNGVTVRCVLGRGGWCRGDAAQVCCETKELQLLLPCGHTSLCRTCAAPMLRVGGPPCPFCRCEVERVVPWVCMS
mmetsp:Transcript_35503/g.82602  ORF Transcript_35503/g.82602 Transcript_35503/m.82602 type:complete len:161 (+) Transcript_35503:516-998(+)